MRSHRHHVWADPETHHRGFGFPPPFPHGGPWGERDHRQGRGRGRGGRGRPNVRNAVLALLVERAMHGYEMIQELERRTGGIWRPSPGSVYPTLQLLEDEGLIAAEESGGRKRFALTDEGRPEAERAAESAPWTEFGDDDVSQARDFREAVFGIMDALRQVGFNGTEDQRSRALEVLVETRRKLYAVLADSES